MGQVEQQGGGDRRHPGLECEDFAKHDNQHRVQLHKGEAHYAQGVSRWPKGEVKLIYTEKFWGYFKLTIC